MILVAPPRPQSGAGDCGPQLGLTWTCDSGSDMNDTGTGDCGVLVDSHLPGDSGPLRASPGSGDFGLQVGLTWTW